MGELDLFTVKVFKASEDNSPISSDRPALINDSNFLEEHPNMISARIIKGRMVELEHSNLVGQSVKFKTVVNFDRALESGDSLGVVLIPQDSYIAKPDHDAHREPK